LPAACLADANGWLITQLAESVPFMSDDLPNRGTGRGQ
jgi:hypothetical protein